MRVEEGPRRLQAAGLRGAGGGKFQVSSAVWLWTLFELRRLIETQVQVLRTLWT